MTISPWIFTLVTVASLLYPTFGDILVQPGYGQPSQSTKNTVGGQNQYQKNQQLGNTKTNYDQEKNSQMQMLQHQHAIQNQYLKAQHQQEENQLLQLQQQQLANPGWQSSQGNGGDIVGTPWGLPGYSSFLPGRFSAGGLHGGKYFSMGPFGLHSLALGNGGFGGFPLLLSPHQPYMTEGGQYTKSMDGPVQPRAKREIRDSTGDSSSKNKHRQKSTYLQQDAMATNPSLKSKSNNVPQNIQSGQKNDNIVGDAQKPGEETVGSSILDPLGLVDKTENLLDDLKSGHLPNPMEMFNKGLAPGLPNWLNKPNLGNSPFEEHVVGNSQQYNNQQYSQQYPQQMKSNYDYMTSNKQGYQSQQSLGGPVVGDPHRPSHSMIPRPPPPPPPRPYGTPYPYATTYPHGTTYSPYRPSWTHRSQSTAYQQGNPIISASNPNPQQYDGQTTKWNGAQMIGSQNPGNQNPIMKFSISRTDDKITGVKEQILEGKPSISSSGKSSSMNSMSDQIVGASNPSSSEHNIVGSETNSDSIIGASNPNSSGQDIVGSPLGTDQLMGMPGSLNSVYELARAVQPMMGTLLNPMSNGFSPNGWNGGSMPFNYQNMGMPGSMRGRSAMNGNYVYDRNGLTNFYNEPQGYRSFDLDDIFDDRGYNHMHHHGGYDRIYDTFVDGNPYGYGGDYPHIHSHHHGYY